VIVTRLTVRDFRSYGSADVHLGPGVTVVSGRNGAGKTNLLEALYFACTGRSCRTGNERECVRFGAALTRLELRCEAAGRQHELSVGFQPGEPKRLRVDGVQVERLTDVVDKTDRSTAVIFADGAGAAVVGASEEPGIGPVAWGSDGDQFSAIEIAAGTGTMTMAGQAVYRWATTRLTDTLLLAMESAGVDPKDVDVFAPHQANLRIVESMTRRLGFREDVVVARDVVQAGNTSAASIPLALTALMESGQARSGDLALLLGYGAGLTFAPIPLAPVVLAVAVARLGFALLTGSNAPVAAQPSRVS